MRKHRDEGKGVVEAGKTVVLRRRVVDGVTVCQRLEDGVMVPLKSSSESPRKRWIPGFLMVGLDVDRLDV